MVGGCWGGGGDGWERNGEGDMVGLRGLPCDNPEGSRDFGTFQTLFGEDIYEIISLK